MSRMRHGVHRELEDAANALIKASLIGVTSNQEKSDILTPWKEKDRISREVYASSGVVDPATRKGMYHRRFNPARPELNSRDGYAPPRHTNPHTDDEIPYRSASEERFSIGLFFDD